MPIKLFRYKDGSYISPRNPLSRRYDVDNEDPQMKKDKKNPKSPRYQKNFIDKFVDKVLER